MNTIPRYISNDKTAEKIGEAIVEDFGLERCIDRPERYKTRWGTFTAVGLGRRAHRIIQEIIDSEFDVKN